MKNQNFSTIILIIFANQQFLVNSTEFISSYFGKSDPPSPKSQKISLITSLYALLNLKNLIEMKLINARGDLENLEKNLVKKYFVDFEEFYKNLMDYQAEKNVKIGNAKQENLHNLLNKMRENGQSINLNEQIKQMQNIAEELDSLEDLFDEGKNFN